MELNLELSWRIGRGSDARVEQHLFDLMRGVDDYGSLRAAARHTRLSYRHAWALVQRWSKTFGQPLVTLERGRGAKLSALGHKLLWAERKLTARLGPELESLSWQVNRELADALRPAVPSRLSAFASHDLALLALRQLLAQRKLSQLDLEFRGSLESLKLLRARKCDLAGFHLPEGALGARLGGRYRAWLDNDVYQVIQVARREQGWMSRKDTPAPSDVPAALRRSSLRFVNRQPGSGTRLALDQMLTEAGVELGSIPGFEMEEFTHLAVAAMVASGAADVGLGIRAAAAKLELHFTPAFHERYVLAVRHKALAEPAVANLVEVLASKPFRQRAQAMKGYDCAGAGTILEVDSFFAALSVSR